MDQENLKSIIYLEDRVKKQDREILTLRSSLNEAHSEVRALNTIVSNQEKQIERLLKTIENTLK